MSPVVPYLLEKVGPSGRVIGIDVADRMHLKAPLVGARPTGLPLEFLSGNLEQVRIRRFFLGVYSLLSARKPAAARPQ